MGAPQIKKDRSGLSCWEELVFEHPVSLLGLEETLTGGQSFSWTSISPSSWQGAINKSLVELQWKEGRIEWRTGIKNPMTHEDLEEYLWLGGSYAKAVDSLPWRSDPVLKRCIDALPGLGILRQPIDETLFVFLLSSVKSIPQIKEMKDLVAQKYGEEIGPRLWSFPGWERLNEVSEEELRSFKLGYRAGYVSKTARFLASHPGWLEEVSRQPYVKAKECLLTLPGVGPKIADCTLLFGAAKSEAFPIDTWIAKALDLRYGLVGWSNQQKVHFAFKHYGKHAGLAQQFLFSGERLGIHEKS